MRLDKAGLKLLRAIIRHNKLVIARIEREQQRRKSWRKQKTST
jgi:hypothetical protein